MILEKIEEEWAKDCRIDETDLNGSQIAAAKLHVKYFRFLNGVKKKLKETECDRDKLTLLKTDYYLGNLDEGTLNEYGWKRNKRVVLKSDLPTFLAADEDMIMANLKVNELSQAVIFLTDIIKMLHNRGFQIKNIIDNKKFENGGF